MAIESASATPQKHRTMFQWGGTVAAITLLIVNGTGRRSSKHTSLLVIYLFICFPTALFKILRGQFGRWVAFLAVAANLFFPRDFHASRFPLFVIIPDWLAVELRDSTTVGGKAIGKSQLVFSLFSSTAAASLNRLFTSICVVADSGINLEFFISSKKLQCQEQLFRTCNKPG
ncbi:unnamed protein product [Fraxinus pennsylvanica]|uniref:Uncharacterized protein n=1 Tax=Fraxinus pennsylvanica TaxID=56036 RepID=A0AAD2DSV2_9LAMI|nr:unnamed protein product [Fraxinus pennsylvanica]